MQIKIKSILCLLAGTFLIGLLLITIYVNTMNCEDLLLVTPTSSDSSEISAEGLEKINGDLFLLTYEIVSKENLQALNANYDVALIKTNFTYPFIMHKKLLEGCFFTEQDQKEEKKSATLNEVAAYAMFGNINICGSKIKIGQDEYTVTGVINDKNEEKSVYIPASISEENPRAFVVGLEANLTREQIKNQCKSVMSEEKGYQLVYFGDLSRLVYGLFYMGLKLTVISIFLILIKRSYYSLQQNIKDYKNLFKKYYARELLQFYPKEVLKTFFVLTEMIFMIILIFNLIFSSIEYFLFWHDNTWILQLNDSSAFRILTSTLRTNIYLSLFFIVGFIINICLLLTETLHFLGDRNNGKNIN
nr:ABC transporter permease [uncultured Aminipila sp.]